VLTLFLTAFIMLMAIGLPIALVLGGSSMAYVLLKDGLSPTIIIQTTFAGLSSFPLLAIPLFILAGNLMKEGGITADLVRFSRLLMGHIRGGLGLAMILASALFAAITGSAVATAVAIGSILLPAMSSAGYDDDISAALTATASCMGPIIPPSIPFIIYGVIANVSIASLFIAGIIPGILLGLALMVYVIWISRQRGYPQEERANLREMLTGTIRALPALALPVIIIGGIFGGVFTPTEAAGIAVVYAMAAGFFFYGRLRISRLPGIFLIAGVESAVIMLLIGLSEPFAWIVAVEQLPTRIMEVIINVSSSPWVFLILINIFLLIIGIPLETAPALTILTPVLAPVAAKMGIDPVHFGIIVCFNLVLGLITPPVGAVLFSICSISGLSLEKLSRAIWVPFLIGVGILMLVTFIPALSTFLPQLFATSSP
jgi:tripartite ATP-independent transporter DctM subunit